MTTHEILGKGPVGSTTADLLGAQGQDVTILSRSGGHDAPGIRHRRVDAADRNALLDATRGAEVIYNCANPRYDRWLSDWPPMASALLDAAETHGAVLVTMSNCYGYGPVEGPITEDLPLAATGRKGQVRARMWAEALDRHRTGRARIVEARASDFIGPRVTDQGHLGQRVVPRVLAAKRAWVLGDPDAPHSWTYIGDVAATLVRLATDERAWGRAWHVPTLPAQSARAMVRGFAQAAHLGEPRVSALPWSMLRAAGLVVPLIAELAETRYQFDQPFIVDSAAATRELGLTATPLDEQLSATVEWWSPVRAAAA